VLFRQQGWRYPDGGARIDQPSALMSVFYLVETVMGQRERAAMEAARIRATRPKHGNK
jgi:hypothetical protein